MRKQVFTWWCFWSAVQVVVVAVPTWLRAHHFGFSNYDFGIYSQGLARLARDAPNPWLSGRQIHLFNDHFDPVLFLVAPFARVFPAADVGLVVEALSGVFALGGLAWMALEGRLSLRALWLLGPLLALNVGVTNAFGFPFHPTTWAMAPMVWLLAALVLERWRVALLMLVLLFACKEEFPFVGLALVPFVWRRAPRHVALGWLSLSVLWAVAAFLLRPVLLGDVMPYARQPLRGIDEGLGAFLLARLDPGVLAGAGDLAVGFVPLIGWLTWKSARGGAGVSLRSTALLSFALLPMLGIRFLSMAWKDHYSAVVVAALVVALVAWLEAVRVPPPWWVLLGTLALVLVTNESMFRRDVRVLSGEIGWGASNDCADVVQRVGAVRSAVELARTAPGPLVVSGNLLPWLAEREDVYALGGPQGESISPGTLLVEQPQCGDTWAQEQETRFRAWDTARRSGRVIIDDGFVVLVTYR